MSLFQAVILSIVVIQRLIELRISKRHELRLKAKGGYEVGRDHYKYIVLMHVLYFVSLIVQILFLHTTIPSFWPILLTIILLTQSLRFWTMATLGERWTTRIIVLPNTPSITSGPYKFLRHPNYLAVTIEIPAIALLLGCHLTAIIFTIWNAGMMAIRIPIEEKALVGP